MTNMVSGNTIAGVAALIADPARANILSALMAGIALTAGELAHAAGVTAQTASGHLTRLVDAEVVAVEKQGRHRYYRLISPEIAQTMELLSIAATAGPRRYHRPGPKDEALRKARTCYDHIAGRLGLALADSMQTCGNVEITDGTATMTPAGMKFLEAFGAELGEPGRNHRPLCRACLDWSERRHHLAGRVGTALLNRLLALKWIELVPGSRALHITPTGAAGLAAHFGVQMEAAS
ncbi:MAG: ArsR family transcriptional regulator [Alphaproteobacteria bacterium]|nr:ArsR family transcriptional regulator [Alphaproteobacteria bacterium]